MLVALGSTYITSAPKNPSDAAWFAVITVILWTVWIGVLVLFIRALPKNGPGHRRLSHLRHADARDSDGIRRSTAKSTRMPLADFGGASTGRESQGRSRSRRRSITAEMWRLAGPLAYFFPFLRPA